MSPIKKDLRWICGASRNPRYIGAGHNPGSLYRFISDLPGLRGQLEKAALKTVGRLRGPSVTNPAICDALDQIFSAFPEATSALLLYTAYYKTSTVLSGIVSSPEPVFVKVFADPQFQSEEEKRYLSLKTVIPSGVQMAPIQLTTARLTAYGLIPRRRRTASHENLINTAIDLAVSSMRKERKAPAFWHQNAKTASQLMERYGSPIKPSSVGWLERLTIPCVVAHGDFTPWNAFETPQGDVALVDYERVGFRAPCADVWHLTTQIHALSGNSVRLPRNHLRIVSRALACEYVTAKQWYCAYLVEELLQDASDWVLHGHRHAKLSKLIERKLMLLEEAVRPELT